MPGARIRKVAVRKLLRAADIRNSGRIVLSKKEAEANLPPLSEVQKNLFIEMHEIGAPNKWIFQYRKIGIIIEEVEGNIEKNTFLANFRMGPLPTLCKKFVELVDILKEGDPSKRDTVVLLLQDMLEVVSRDMMVNEIRGRHASKITEEEEDEEYLKEEEDTFSGAASTRLVTQPSCIKGKMRDYQLAASAFAQFYAQ